MVRLLWSPSTFVNSTQQSKLLSWHKDDAQYDYPSKKAAKEKDLPSYMMGGLIDPSTKMRYLEARCPIEEKRYSKTDSHHGISPSVYGFASPIERQAHQPYVWIICLGYYRVWMIPFSWEKKEQKPSHIKLSLSRRFYFGVMTGVIILVVLSSVERENTWITCYVLGPLAWNHAERRLDAVMSYIYQESDFCLSSDNFT